MARDKARVWYDRDGDYLEVDAALTGTFVQRFKSVYGVRREGNFRDGKNILHRLGPTATQQISDADAALLARQRELLLAARKKRTAPMRDDKVVADWNGYAIMALANASGVDEVMITTMAHEHADRRRSYELVAEAFGLPSS